MAPSLQETLGRSSELTREGRHEEHLVLMEEALHRHPDELEVVLRTAGARIAEAPEGAAELARKAAELAPEDPNTFTRAAQVMLATGQLKDARGLCVRAYRSGSEGFELVFDLAYIAGRVALGYGEEDRAVELLQVAFDNAPETPGYGLVLAEVLERRGERERALEVLEQAFRHRPADREVDVRRIYLRVALHGPDALPPGYTFTTTD